MSAIVDCGGSALSLFLGGSSPPGLHLYNCPLGRGARIGAEIFSWAFP